MGMVLRLAVVRGCDLKGGLAMRVDMNLPSKRMRNEGVLTRFEARALLLEL